MKIRQAEPRDYEAVKAMFLKLCDYLEGKGQWLLTQDPVERVNGVGAFLMLKMFGHEDSVVLVAEEEGGEISGFIIGWMRYYPAFFKYRRVGEIQFMYPLSFDKSPRLYTAFEKWAKDRGATATCNYATPDHETSIKVFERAGRRLSHYVFYKPFQQEGTKNGQLLHG